MADQDLVVETYGRVAARYGDAFSEELSFKPLDRALLEWFAADTSNRDSRTIADLGTGPGQVARFLRDRGLDVVGIDLSPAMVDQARSRHPDIPFLVGDLLHLDTPDQAFGGLTAFYSIVHLDRADLLRAFVEARRVLAPGGALLIAWHVGEGVLCPEEFLGEPCSIAWHFFPMATVVSAVEEAGLAAEVRLERAPYPTEHQSTRGYLLARRARQ